MILKIKKELEDMPHLVLKLAKATVIKRVQCYHNNKCKSVEQNFKPRNKALDLWSTDL